MLIGIAIDGPHACLAFVARFGEQPGFVAFENPAGDSQAGPLGLLRIRSQAPTLHEVDHVHVAIVETKLEHLGSSS